MPLSNRAGDYKLFVRICERATRQTKLRGAARAATFTACAACGYFAGLSRILGTLCNAPVPNGLPLRRLRTIWRLGRASANFQI